MSVKEEIKNLMEETNLEKKKKIKEKLKKLYRKRNTKKTTRKTRLRLPKHNIKLPIKREVEEILSGEFKNVQKNKVAFKLLEKDQTQKIKVLRKKLDEAGNEEEKAEIKAQIDDEKSKNEILKQAEKSGRSVQSAVQSVKDWGAIESYDELLQFVHTNPTTKANAIGRKLTLLRLHGETEKDYKQFKKDLENYEPLEVSESDAEEGLIQVENPEEEARLAEIYENLERERERLNRGQELEKHVLGKHVLGKQSRPSIEEMIDQLLKYHTASGAIKMLKKGKAQLIAEMLANPEKVLEEYKNMLAKRAIENSTPLEHRNLFTEKELKQIEAEFQAHVDAAVRDLQWGTLRNKKQNLIPQSESDEEKEEEEKPLINLFPDESNGQGKRRGRKPRGGAGIGDYLSTIGHLPGLSQALNMVPVIGPMLGVASSLGQTGAKLASQGMKEASNNGEKISGFSGLLGPLKSMFGFGKMKRGGGPFKNFKNFLVQHQADINHPLQQLQAHLNNPSGGSLKDKIKSFWSKHKDKLIPAGIATATALGSVAAHLISEHNKNPKPSSSSSSSVPVDNSERYQAPDGKLPMPLQLGMKGHAEAYRKNPTEYLRAWSGSENYKGDDVKEALERNKQAQAEQIAKMNFRSPFEVERDVINRLNQNFGSGLFLKDQKQVDKEMNDHILKSMLAQMEKTMKANAERLKAKGGGSKHEKAVMKELKQFHKHTKAVVKGGGFISDIFNKVGSLTPVASSILGKIPGIGPILQIGNSALGSASRVGEDLAGMIGLGSASTFDGGMKMIANPNDPMGLYNKPPTPYGRPIDRRYFPTAFGEPLPTALGQGVIPKEYKKFYKPYILDKNLTPESYGFGNLPFGKNISGEMEDAINDEILKSLKNKALGKMAEAREFDAKIANQQNADQQNAVQQLMYTKLLAEAQEREINKV